MNFTKFSGDHRKVIISGIIFLVSVLALWFGLKAVLSTELPLLAVDSTSMYPALNYGDLIVVQGIADVSEINVGPAPQGDIVVFRRPNEPDVLVISRVIDKTLENDVWYLRTQADLQDLPDWWITGLNSEDVQKGFVHEKFLVGKVVSRIPFLGYVPLYVSMYVLNPIVVFLVSMYVLNPIVVFLVIIALFFILFLKYPSLFGKKSKA